MHDIRGTLRCARSLSLASLILVTLVGSPGQASAQESGDSQTPSIRDLLSQPELTLGLLLQAVVDPGIDDTPASAQVAAARILLSGTLDRGFSYFLQTNFAGSPSLLDGRVGWSPGPAFHVYAGRFKAPFSRELLTFAGSIDFVNRARVVEALAPNRQMGVEAGGAVGPWLRWAAGGFTGRSSATPNESLAGVFRLEGAGIETSHGTVSLAAHAAVGRDGAVGVGPFGPSYVGDGVLLGLDGRAELGRLLLSGELIRADWDPTGLPDVDADGLYLTAGWMVIPDHQALVRWDRYAAPGASADDALILGYNVWPTAESEVQVNLVVPVADGAEPYRLLINFQVGF